VYRVHTCCINVTHGQYDVSVATQGQKAENEEGYPDILYC